MHRKASFRLASAISLVALVSGVPAFGSSHREAPNITKMPKVDGTDFYMFRSYEPGRSGFVTLIANYEPLQGPGDGPNYYTLDPDAVYEIHIDNNGDAVEDLTYQFKFQNTLNGDTGIALDVGGKSVKIPLRAIPEVGKRADDPQQNEYEAYRVFQVTGDARSGTKAAITYDGNRDLFRKPIDNIGTKTVPNYPNYAKQFIYDIDIPGCSVKGRVFVGQRAEAFAVNLGPIFDSANLVPIEGDSAPGAGDGGGFPGGITQNRANDELVGKKNVTSLALELPISCIKGSGNGVIGAWTTASLPQARILDPTPTYPAPSVSGGAYVQVSRVGMPLVNELVIGLAQKDLFNSAEPKGDSALADYVTNPTFPAIVNLLFKTAVNTTLGTNIADLAPSNFPRNDLVATYLTGFVGVNQMATVTPSEMVRLNTGINPTPRATQSAFGVAGDDLAGFPNGRRPGDDVVDITLRVAMGRLCYPVPVNGKNTDLGLCVPANAPVGNVPFTDGAPLSAMDVGNAFPYLNSPIPGAPLSARPK